IRVDRVEIGPLRLHCHFDFLPTLGERRLTAGLAAVSRQSRRPVHRPNQEPRSTKNSAVKLTRHRPVAGSKSSPFQATTWLKSPSIASRRAAATARAELTLFA